MPPGPAESRSDTSLGDFKSQVLGATDIVDLIGRTVSLKKRGKDHVGLCPFHTEKSPSFTVSQSKQFFYCYGCKAGGDAISFVKLRDRVEFMDALKSLATDAGIPIPRFGRGRAEDVTETQTCLDANSLSAMFFEQTLADPNRGKAARDYLTSRGINEETTKKFRIGLAGEGWENLLRGPVGKKFTAQQLQLAGLVKARDPEKGPGHYDVFRNRLMFPIRDPNGRVIAFGGRRMLESENPKYLNSPETPVFSKGKALYGLDLARQRIVETQTAVIVEGYTDVVMAHQFGATNVVATLGTAMTPEHVSLLRRFAGRIVLLFDPDTAGDIAVDRAVGLFLTQPIEIGIANLGEDLDPDEYLLKYGLEAFEKLITEATSALAYKWKQLVRDFSADNGNNLTGQQKAIEAYLEVVAQARQSGPIDSIRWGLMLSQIAKLTGISAEQLQRQLSAIRSVPKKPAMPVVGPSGTPAAAPTLEPRRKPSVLSARHLSEKRLLGVLLLWPDRWQQVQASIGVEDFLDPDHRRLAEVYWTHQRDEGEPVLGEFLALLSQDGKPDIQMRELAMSCVDDVESLGEVDSVFDTAVSDMLECLRRERETLEKRKLVTTLERKKTEGRDDQAETDLLRQMIGLHHKKPPELPGK